MGTDFDRETVSFNINVECERYQIPRLIALLKEFEHCGAIGHTSQMIVLADGDGAFRPKFEFDIDPGKSNEYTPQLIDHSLVNPNDSNDRYYIDKYFDLG